MKIKTSITGAATKLLVSLCLALSAGLVQAASVEVTYYHNDLLGSPVAATNENGELKWIKSYKPYGEEIVTAEDSEQEFVGYTGHRLDKETGLVYAGARHYDPLIGRFYGNDPVGFTESNPMMFNRYAYGNNNPYKYVDPDGEEAKRPGSGDGAAALARELSVLFGMQTRETAMLREGIVLGGKKGKGGKGKAAKTGGRSGKQTRLKELGDDLKLGKADRGWIKQEKNAIARGSRKTIRNPKGKDLAHERGREAAKGYDYKHSNLQDRKLHSLQHKYDNFGKKNKERPPK